eukprot:g8125.t1
MRTTSYLETQDNDALLPRINSDEHETIRDIQYSQNIAESNELVTQEELAKYKTLRAAEEENRTRQRRRIKALETAKKYADVEEALRQKANITAAVKIEKSESEARERAKNQSSFPNGTKSNGNKCTKYWNRCFDRLSVSLKQTANTDQELINSVQYEELS